MEIFAQLLDDCEDLLCALPLLWERTRWVPLRLGLAAAIGVPLADARWVPLLAIVALTVSTGWLLALAASQAGRIRRQPI